MDFFDLNLIFVTMENIVKEKTIVNLHDNGNFPGFDSEDSCLYFDDNGQLVWKCFIGTKDEEVITVREECTEHVIKKILELLLQNKLISKDTYKFLICEDELYINLDNVFKQLIDYKIL